MTLASLQKKAAALASALFGPTSPPKRTAKVAAELLPIIERLIEPHAHPHTLLAIATADTVIVEQNQRSFGDVVIRFIVIDTDGAVDITPLPGTKLELDVILVKRGKNATLRLLNDSISMLRHEILVEQDATLTLLVGHINAGGTYTRQTTLLGSGSTLHDSEFLVGKNALILDNSVVHDAVGTTARVAQSGVLVGNGSVDAKGTLRVLSRSARTDTFLSARWLLLSSDAAAKVLPALEIENDDVKASHAATVQPIEEEQIFYLQNRGMDRDSAQELIVQGFIGAVLEEWPEQTRARLRARVNRFIEVTHD